MVERGMRLSSNRSGVVGCFGASSIDVVAIRFIGDGDVVGLFFLHGSTCRKSWPHD